MVQAQHVSKDNPATLRRTKDGVEVIVEDPAEYQTLVYTAGYRDVSDEGGGDQQAQQQPAQQPAQQQRPQQAAQQPAQSAPAQSAPAEPS